MSRRKIMLLITGIICAACVAAMIVILARGPKQVVCFTPPPFDEAATEGVPALTEADGYRPIDAQVFVFSICGELVLEDGKTDVWLTNNAENTVWLKVKLMDTEGNVLGETGLVRPGEYVQSLRLTAPPEATTEVVMSVMSYEPETYYSMGSVSLYTTLTVPETGD